MGRNNGGAPGVIRQILEFISEKGGGGRGTPGAGPGSWIRHENPAVTSASLTLFWQRPE